MRNIIRGSVRWADEEGGAIVAMIKRGEHEIEDFFYPGEPEWDSIVAGGFGEVAAYAERPMAKGDLVKIAQEKRDAALRGDMRIDIGGGIFVTVQAAKRDEFDRTAMRAARSSKATFSWTSSAGVIELTAAQVKHMQDALDARDDEARAAYGANVAAIQAGEITMASQLG